GTGWPPGPPGRVVPPLAGTTTPAPRPARITPRSRAIVRTPVFVSNVNWPWSPPRARVRRSRRAQRHRGSLAADERPAARSFAARRRHAADGVADAVAASPAMVSVAGELAELSKVFSTAAWPVGPAGDCAEAASTPPPASSAASASPAPPHSPRPRSGPFPRGGDPDGPPAGGGWPPRRPGGWPHGCPEGWPQGCGPG